ncbi:ABC transporter permease [Nocardiopsis exhalans]|uniref:ABC transporter permease n=1 Tax=Nocardiopsis exhalans TaxID=163604 RepID=A0ABY5D5I2_9ACTN|nr:ABC transporter permease [Nocardiopsis exhalans]USY18416.1 ABC transporter permease [Nocardiopsis exhalans]
MIRLFGEVVRRLLIGVLVVFGAASAGFLAMRLAPGDPVRTMLGASQPEPELVESLRHTLGLDEPVSVQYGWFLLRLVQGDLGTSYQLQRSVSGLIAEHLPWTLALGTTALVLALCMAVPLAVATAGRRPVLRRIASLFELVTISTPSFWVGILLLGLLSFRWQLVPAVGGAGIGGLLLPAFTLALSLVGVFVQVMRA